MESQAKFSLTERLIGWIVLCGDLCSTIALIFAAIVIALLTWSWPDSAR